MVYLVIKKIKWFTLRRKTKKGAERDTRGGKIKRTRMSYKVRATSPEPPHQIRLRIIPDFIFEGVKLTNLKS